MTSNTLEKATLEELKKEIERRRRTVPRTLDGPKSFAATMQLMDKGMNEAAKNGRVPRGLYTVVAESALKAMYGDGVLDWLNELRSVEVSGMFASASKVNQLRES